MRRKDALENDENMVTQEALDQNVSLPTWDNSSVDVNQSDYEIDTTGYTILDEFDTFGEIDYYDNDGMP
jgi:hypothetical protein